MKKFIVSTTQLIIVALLALVPSTTIARKQGGANWQPLVMVGTTGVAVSCTRQEAQQAWQISFRHNFPGYTRISMVVRLQDIDGRESIKTLTACGLSNGMSGFSSNLISDSVVSNSIESVTVWYKAYGIYYQLTIAADGRKELTMDGRPYNYGPQYVLLLNALPIPDDNRNNRAVPYPIAPVVTHK